MSNSFTIDYSLQEATFTYANFIVIYYRITRGV
jgi:hypothetical protein